MSSPSPIAIDGDLTMGYVAEAMKRIVNMPEKSKVVIDLKGAGEADSSAVAFLLNCIRIGHARGSTVKFASVPASILTLADIYGLKPVITEAMLAA